MIGQRGFSLIELVVTMGLLAVIIALATPTLTSLYHRNDVALVTQAVVTSIRRAQTLAAAGANDGSWGVQIGTSSVVVFQGDSYPKRDLTQDDLTPYPSPVTVTGSSQYIFVEMGATTTASTTVLTTGTGDSRTLTVNAYGTITY